MEFFEPRKGPLFRNKRLMLDEIVQRNTSKFAIFF
jgi:MoxR-like ATPase